MFLFPIGFFYACFMVAGKRIAAKQRKENAVFFGMESGWRTNASFDFIEPSARPQFSHKGVPGKASKMILWGRGGTAK